MESDLKPPHKWAIKYKDGADFEALANGLWEEKWKAEKAFVTYLLISNLMVRKEARHGLIAQIRTWTTSPFVASSPLIQTLPAAVWTLPQTGQYLKPKAKPPKAQPGGHSKTLVVNAKIIALSDHGHWGLLLFQKCTTPELISHVDLLSKSGQDMKCTQRNTSATWISMYLWNIFHTHNYKSTALKKKYVVLFQEY